VALTDTPGRAATETAVGVFARYLRPMGLRPLAGTGFPSRSGASTRALPAMRTYREFLCDIGLTRTRLREAALPAWYKRVSRVIK